MTRSVEINYYGVPITVFGEYEPADEEVGAAEDFTIEKVMVESTNITPIMTADDFTDISNRVLQVIGEES